MELRRKSFQGVLNILSFNRHFYVFGILILILVIASNLFFIWPPTLYWLTILVFIYGLLMPLIISAYVYDFSGYYNFDWLNKCNIDHLNTKHIVNINAGFDETSFIIKNNFPEAHLDVFDFYNPKQHTEAAIIRARKVSLVYPNTKQIESNCIPLEDKSVDIIFLLSSAHEIRLEKEKIEFLKECYRICNPKGKVIMIEHLRDLPNFFAFSVGFAHFFSKNTWEKAFKSAGFSSIKEIKFTPFMSIFNCN